MAEKSVNRLDADDAIFFKRQLEAVKGRTYDQKLADLKYAQFLPVNADTPAGATEITWRSFSGYGFAKIIADYAKDFPRTDIGGTEHTVKVKDLGSSYAYSIREIQRAAMAGLALEARRASMARRAIEEKLNTIAWSGDTTANIQGFLNYPGATTYTVPATGTGTTKTWSTKTGAQILTDLFGICNAVIEGTYGKEVPNQILLPLAQYNLIKQTRVSDYSDTTVYEFFTKNMPGVAIDWLKELDGAGTGSTGLFVAYVKDSDHVTFEVPNAFEQLEEEKEGMEYKVPCWASTAGVIVYYAASVCFGAGI